VARTAVIVIGGGTPDERVCAELPVERRVIAADSGLDAARFLGLTVDLLVGDLDSVSAAGLATAEATGTVVERHPPAKDATDTELAIAAARRDGCDHLIGVSGGPRADDPRLDHELGGLLAFAHPDLAAVRVELWWGSTHLEVLHGPSSAGLRGGPGDTVSLLPLHGPASGVVTTGLRYPLRAEELPPGSSRGLSNVVDGVPASVRLEAGTLLVIHPPATGDPR
jgi:thiamine pyrophosphokinase